MGRRNHRDQQGILHQAEYSAAHDLFKESLTISNDIGFKWGIAFAAEGLASIAACEGQARHAILLAGGAFAIRGAIGTPLSALAQTDFEQILSPARTLLGEEARNRSGPKAWDYPSNKLLQRLKSNIMNKSRIKALNCILFILPVPTLATMPTDHL